MQATKSFHSAFDIPDGATLTVEASGLSGNVQADATFLSGSENVDDADWSLDDIENGNAQTTVEGPGISIARVRLAMSQGARAQFDIVIQNEGQDIRRRTWTFAPDDSNLVTRFGLIIS